MNSPTISIFPPDTSGYQSTITSTASSSSSPTLLSTLLLLVYVCSDKWLLNTTFLIRLLYRTTLDLPHQSLDLNWQCLVISRLLQLHFLVLSYCSYFCGWIGSLGFQIVNRGRSCFLGFLVNVVLLGGALFLSKASFHCIVLCLSLASPLVLLSSMVIQICIYSFYLYYGAQFWIIIY